MKFFGQTLQRKILLKKLLFNIFDYAAPKVYSLGLLINLFASNKKFRHTGDAHLSTCDVTFFFYPDQYRLLFLPVSIAVHATTTCHVHKYITLRNIQPIHKIRSNEACTKWF